MAPEQASPRRTVTLALKANGRQQPQAMSAHKQGKNPAHIAPVLAQYPKEAGIHMATPKQNEEQRC